MTEEAPICPKCEIRPRAKCKGATKKYHSYCCECQTKRDKEKWQGRKEEKGKSSIITHPVLCIACEKRKPRKGQKFCNVCYDQATQVIIWGRIAEKIEELVKYITKQAEFPPRIEKRAESRIKDAMDNLNFAINLMEEENGINKKNR